MSSFNRMRFENTFRSYEGKETFVEMVIEEDCLPEILEQFAAFLRGCGYCVDGELEIVKHDFNIPKGRKVFVDDIDEALEDLEALKTFEDLETKNV